MPPAQPDAPDHTRDRLPSMMTRPVGWTSRDWLTRLLLVAPLLALLPLVWQLLAHAMAVLTYPWQIDYDEGIVLRAAWMIAQGQNPYHAPRPEAFTSATYPPLFYLLNALWLRLGGISLFGGRLIGLLATLVVALLLALWSRATGRSWLAGGLAAALWLSLSPVYVWSTFYKPDLLAIALTMIGLAAARAWPRWPGLAGAAVVFALAFLTKQSALIGPLAVGLWLLASRGAWLRFGLWSGGLLVLVTAIGNLVTGGGLWLHTITFQQLPWSPGQLSHNLEKLTDTYPWLLLAGLVALGWHLVGPYLATASGAGRPPPPGPVWRWPFDLSVWYLLAAMPAVLIANGRIGVNFGLLLDLFPPLCLLIAGAAGDLAASPADDRRGSSAAPAAQRPGPRLLRPTLLAGLSLLLLAQALLPNPPGAWYSANRMPSAERASRMRSLAGIVEQTPGRILAEDLWLLLRANKPIEYDDPFLMAQSAQRGLWDERRFVADLEAQRFSLVVLEYEITDVPRSPRWTPAALAALRSNYEILHRDALFVHRPRSLLRAPGTPRELLFGQQLRLVETAVSATSTRAGGTVRLMVRWVLTGPATTDYMLFVHLIDATGQVRAQIDVPPAARPTRAWKIGERLEIEYPLTLPDDTPAGRYQLMIGLYDPANGQRLPATQSGQPAGDAVPIAAIEVGA